MFGFIKNLFAGIFGFLGRLLGLKKSEYFLDLDDSQGKGSAKAEPAKAVAAAPASTPAKAEKPVAAKAKASTPAKAPESAAPKATPVAPAAAPVATNGKVSAQAAAATFAPNYLMPTPTASRRLPGPNMNSFREMARQVKSK